MEGSSATMTIMPPFTPVMAEFTKASAATFSPTCFMQAITRPPAYETPNAASTAVFSFVHQVLCRPRSRAKGCRWIYSVISVLGVPG